MAKVEINTLLGEETAAEARVIQTLRQRGPTSAADIARILGLGRSTISRVVGSLRESDVVVDTALSHTNQKGRGRPGTLLSLNPIAGTCAGVLLGPDWIRVALADVSHAVLDSRTQQLHVDYTVEEGLTATSELIAAAYAHTGLSRERLLGVGIAIPGAVDRHTGRLLKSNVVPVWEGADAKAIFSAALDTPIYADNEANCTAIAEMTWGAGRGEPDFLFLKLDMGVGGCVVMNHRVVRGVAGIAGHFGHVTYDLNGPLCGCGRRGCLELYAGWEAVLEPARKRFGSNVTYERIAQNARAGDMGCRHLIEDAAEIVGRALASISMALNPPLIVVGGRQLVAADILLPALIESFDRHSAIKQGDLPEKSRTRIVQGRFTSDQDATLGAIGLVLGAEDNRSY
jgi:predicted NBD/HSP70 family sugar kinase/biotin operon repressor